MTHQQLVANRANAQLSTGPASAAGKAKTSLNAVKTALTGRTVLLPAEDAVLYERHIRAYQHELQPVGQRECDLVQAIADAAWRLARIPGLEMVFYAQGQIEFANTFDDHDPGLRAGLIDLQVCLKYERQLRNLQLQEARLHRRREKDTAELRQLQQQRETKEMQALDAAAQQYVAAKTANCAFDPKENGFEFSIGQIEAYLKTHSPSWLALIVQKAASEPALAPSRASVQAA